MNYVKSLVKRAPTWLVEWAESAFRALPPSSTYGKPYRQGVSLFDESETWDEKTLADYQSKLLRRLIEHAYSNVPYYREVFQERGLEPKDIQGVADLDKLPLLTKETVLRRKHDLLASNISFLHLEPVRTSGSSGAPLDFFHDRQLKGMERALALRHLKWIGYKPGDKVAMFKAVPLTDPRKTFRYFPGARELRISFHNTDETRLAMMMEALESFRPDFVDGWPSCLYILSRWIEKNRMSIPSPKAIRTSSENLHPHVREYVESVFGAPVIDLYGQEESVAVAMQCSEQQGYHVQMEMAVMELLPSSREDAWEIVGTCLHNFGMPLIRYRTGDLAVKGESHCSCRRCHPTLAGIVGREGDVVITPEKSLVSPLVLDYAFLHLDEIKESQIIQEDLRTLRIRVVPWDTISHTTRERLLRELQSRLESPEMELIIEEVEDIPRTEGGKRPFVISHLEREDRIQYTSR